MADPPNNCDGPASLAARTMPTREKGSHTVTGSSSVMRQSDPNAWRVASVPVSGVTGAIEPRSHGLGFPGQSFYGWLSPAAEGMSARFNGLLSSPTGIYTLRYYWRTTLESPPKPPRLRNVGRYFRSRRPRVSHFLPPSALPIRVIDYPHAVPREALRDPARMLE